MQINLQKIGIVKDSSIMLDGLTVITGKNNSGKSTVGKALYSILDSVCNIQKKAQIDRSIYILRQISKVEDTLDMLRLLQKPALVDDDALENYPALAMLMSGNYHHEFPMSDMEKYAHALAAELNAVDIAIFANGNELLKSYFRHVYSNGDEKEGVSFQSMFEAEKTQALELLENIFANIKKDPQLISYARESINQTLQVEFSNQIQPVRDSTAQSRIQLMDSDSGATYFDIAIENNAVLNNGTPVYFSSPYKKVYMIDDPLILDQGNSRRISLRKGADDMDTILNSGRIQSHNDKLRSQLHPRGANISVFEKTVLDDSLREIAEQLDKIVPGNFEFSSEGEYYVKDGMKLRISNLATGSKMFSIIKMLLKMGELDKTTMLVLDEPEAHLHPMWQNAFAEVIALLVKKLEVSVLLTTHSPNFMLAIDAYMRKHEITNKTNFYQTAILEDGFVKYECLNDDMGKIYQDFLQYLSEVKMLRNRYVHGIAGEDE